MCLECCLEWIVWINKLYWRRQTVPDTWTTDWESMSAKLCSCSTDNGGSGCWWPLLTSLRIVGAEAEGAEVVDAWSTVVIENAVHDRCNFIWNLSGSQQSFCRAAAKLNFLAPALWGNCGFYGCRTILCFKPWGYSACQERQYMQCAWAVVVD